MTAKLSSQHGTSVDKRCPSFASCQLPWGKEEEEDVSEQVAMWGFIQSLQCSVGLTFCPSGSLYLLRHFLWHPKTFLDVAKPTCCLTSHYPVAASFCLPPVLYLCIAGLKLGAGSKPCPVNAPAGRSRKAVFTPSDKTLARIICLSSGECLTPGKVLAYLICSEIQQGLTS